MHELTDLPDDRAHIPEHRAGNARMRRQGTRNLLAATQAASANRFIAQSVAWKIPGDGGAAVEEHERAVLDFSGVVIRYGQFYGPAPTSSLSCRHRRVYMWTTPRVARCPRSSNPAACWLFSRTSRTEPAPGDRHRRDQRAVGDVRLRDQSHPAHPNGLQDHAADDY